MNAVGRADAEPRPRRQRSVLLSGVLLGIGVVGAIDEAVFHDSCSGAPCTGAPMRTGAS
jgi:hypothetical protein